MASVLGEIRFRAAPIPAARKQCGRRPSPESEKCLEYQGSG